MFVRPSFLALLSLLRRLLSPDPSLRWTFDCIILDVITSPSSVLRVTWRVRNPDSPDSQATPSQRNTPLHIYRGNQETTSSPVDENSASVPVGGVHGGASRRNVCVSG